MSAARRPSVVMVAAMALALARCDAGESSSLGLGEPIRVTGAQFIAGPLPGAPPGASSDGPTMTNVTAASRIVLPGEVGKRFDGRASKGASSVALRLADVGSGYWVVPVGAEDGQFPGEWTFQAVSSFGRAAPGYHTLLFAAVDANGHAGSQTDVALCFAPEIPDNLASCIPGATPPALVVDLAWDADVDLDLVLVGPAGRRVDGKSPTTTGPDPDSGALQPDAGVLQRDSLAACVKDGHRREDVVWQRAPKGVGYDVYARLFDACGKKAVSFVLTVYQVGTLLPDRTVKGRLTDYDATGGSTTGTYLTSLVFP